MDRELIDALTQQTIGMNEPYVAASLPRARATASPRLQEGAAIARKRSYLACGFSRGVGSTADTRGGDRRHAGGSSPLARRLRAEHRRFDQDFRGAISRSNRERAPFKDVETSLEDLRTTQDRLVQTQKLASLGQLTAGIAHEIKNPLNFVNNFSGVSFELIDELQETLRAFAR